MELNSAEIQSQLCFPKRVLFERIDVETVTKALSLFTCRDQSLENSMNSNVLDNMIYAVMTVLISDQYCSNYTLTLV